MTATYNTRTEATLGSRRMVSPGGLQQARNPRDRDGIGHTAWAVGWGALFSLVLMVMACGCSATSSPADDGTSSGAELSYYQDIQPIYQKHCGYCHAGCAPDKCAGGSCFATYHEALLYPASVCNDQMNIAECGIYRMEYTKQVDGPPHLKLVGEDNLPVIVPDEDIAKVSQWVQQGMPIGTPPPPISSECVPDCTNKECGCDGCGGLCEGACPEFFFCQHAAGTCTIISNEHDPNCVPDCPPAVQCGSDSCGGSCGTCEPGNTCNSTGQCSRCTPDCLEKPCGGSNGCGAPCPITCEGTCDPTTGECDD